MFFKKEKYRLLCIVAVVVSSLFLMTSCAEKAVIKEEPSSVPETKKEEVAPPSEVKEEMQVEAEKGIDEEALREEALRMVADQVQDIFFAFDRYDLSDTAKKKLENAAFALKGNFVINIVIEGHCDERGTVEYNLVLGEKRASTVKKYLANLGVKSESINTISYGEEKPFDSAHNEIAWAKNRRAHFVLK